eukprot:TRINITY_DN3462_c0_g1_i1.p1 TRINITY_DN3462_c0_g1~~TRINITY_DN3462_c0_g1_i1.p1  ORF type:complete len:469 (-),score=119.94 TRINITY_DN3462_c0_g1_i1:41-1405(-)
MDSMEHSQLLEEKSPNELSKGHKTKLKINKLLNILKQPMDRSLKLDELRFSEFNDNIDNKMITMNSSYIPSTNEGYLLMQKRGTSSWSKFYSRIHGTQFCIYKNERDEKPIIEFDWTWVHKGSFSTREREQIVNSKFLHSSATKMQLFSNHNVRTLCATNEEESNKWVETFQQIMKNNISEEQFKKKKEASEELQHLFDKDLEDDMLKSLQVAKILALQGFGQENRVDGALKQGKLEMYEDYGDITKRFKPYFFILKNKHLYYNPRKQEHKTGVISLRFSTIEESDSNQPDHERRFKITTPMVTYQLRAKHEVAAEEWVKVLIDCKLGKSKKSMQNLLLQQRKKDDDLNIENLPQFSNPELHVKVGDKLKKVKLKNKDVLIGRSSGCSLQLNDKHISREHVKISYRGPNKWILYDLGSHTGTKVNNNTVLKHLLKPGDIFEIGNTEITFYAKEK